MATAPGSATAYVEALFALLPPGRFWRRGDLSTRLARTFRGLAEEAVRIHDRGLDLIEELDPRTATDTIDAWERLLGLPDPCVSEALQPSTLGERQDAAFAKWTSRGGQSAAYFEDLAIALGVGPPVNIVEGPYLPFRVAIGRMGDRLNPHGSQFIWILQAPAATPLDKRAQLECLVDRYKPAHTLALYEYTL